MHRQCKDCKSITVRRVQGELQIPVFDNSLSMWNCGLIMRWGLCTTPTRPPLPPREKVERKNSFKEKNTAIFLYQASPGYVFVSRWISVPTGTLYSQHPRDRVPQGTPNPEPNRNICTVQASVILGIGNVTPWLSTAQVLTPQ